MAMVTQITLSKETLYRVVEQIFKEKGNTYELFVKIDKAVQT